MAEKWKNKMNGKQFLKNNSGGALVEFALAASLMLTLAFGVIDFTRAIYDLQVMMNLTGEGSNLASRGTSLSDTATAVVNGASPLEFGTEGCVIVSSVYNDGSTVKVSGQATQCPNPQISKIGTVGSLANLPSGAVPQANQTVFATEIFYSYQTITPIGKLLQTTLPSKLYDVAYY